MRFPRIDTKTKFYKNCVRQRKRNAKICQDCPFRSGIELQEQMTESIKAAIEKEKEK